MMKMRFGLATRRHLVRAGMIAGLATLLLALLAPMVFASDSGFSAYPPPPPESPIVGDVTLDGRVSVADAVAILQYTVGARELDEIQLYAADTSGDKRVSVADAVHILQYTVDPTGAQSILARDLWDWEYHAGLWDPQGQNSGK